MKGFTGAAWRRLHSATAAGAVALSVLAAMPACAADASAALTWTTLGTAAGPVLYAERSQPANLLSVDGRPWLIDCGDGALERLAALHLRAAQIDTVVISHLHMDHIGGLQGLLGLRWMQNAKRKLTIYGPPGTDAVVAGLVASLKPVAAIDGKQAGHGDPATMVDVVTLRDGADIDVQGVRLRAVRNSHFDVTPGHPLENGTQSLSLRFDYKGRAIGYTGDTGPSDAVARLEQGVDVLVSEVIDIEPTIAGIAQAMGRMSPDAREHLIEHLKTQHLTPREAGALATKANAKQLVFTHLAIAGSTDGSRDTLINGAKETFDGPVAVAHDLDRF
ncbi:metallo-beta-lactamase [Pandoraea morbifera]|uniref:Metallo-beta-lactamase n=1 Tax=Pandoraea morbifera TaxID=2508300 RepID=A0A5E4XR85_9BURK|nr:MBL fold metallo-hydrolase [Pandoraea morbifera]VVE38850.1 metallo-beta-lactamase [Pandoraea morbifera]